MPKNFKNFNFGNSGARFREVSKEVYYASGKIIKLGKSDIELFREKAGNNEPKKIRLCTHRDVNDKLHEMFIMFGKGAYVKPHKHPGKSISYHIVEGSADVVLFNESGRIAEVIKMGDYLSGRVFYFRIDDPFYYMPVPKSNILVFHEITNGPFNNDTVFAPWAPAENDKAAVQEFMEKLRMSTRDFFGRKNHTP